ncbi:MAG: hypothetical protein U1F36_10135 [Planctomycetota bacterium]
MTTIVRCAAIGATQIADNETAVSFGNMVPVLLHESVGRRIVARSDDSEAEEPQPTRRPGPFWSARSGDAATRRPEWVATQAAMSNCTTAPRNGIVSDCHPLDPHDRAMPEAARLRDLKRALPAPPDRG